MVLLKEENLLDFLAEGFLQEGASVTYTNLNGISGLRVTSEDGRSKVYISSEEKLSKMAFLKGNISEEILIPVLKTEEELRLKAALSRNKLQNIKVYKLPLQVRFNWYSRKMLCNRN